MKIIFTTIALFISAFSILNTQEKLHINSAQSEIKWSGEYTFYFGGHEGYIDFESGYFIKTGDVITGGEFSIDMNSITCLDIKEDEANEGLVNHLKDPDFFDVATFPKASIKITNVEYHDPTHMKMHFKLKLILKSNYYLQNLKLIE